MTTQPLQFQSTAETMDMIQHIDHSVARLIHPLDLHGVRDIGREGQPDRHRKFSQNIEFTDNNTKVVVRASNTFYGDKQCIIIKNLRKLAIVLDSASPLEEVDGAKTAPIYANQIILDSLVPGIRVERDVELEEEEQIYRSIAVSAELGLRVYAEAAGGFAAPTGPYIGATAGFEINATLGVGTEISNMKTNRKTIIYKFDTANLKPRLLSRSGDTVFLDRTIVRKAKQQTFVMSVLLGYDVEVWSTGFGDRDAWDKKKEYLKKNGSLEEGWLQPLDVDKKDRESPHYKWVDTEGASSVLNYFDGEGKHANSFRHAIAEGEHPLRTIGDLNSPYKKGIILEAAKALQDASKTSFQQTEKIVFNNATSENISIMFKHQRNNIIAKRAAEAEAAKKAEAAQKAKQG